MNRKSRLGTYRTRVIAVASAAAVTVSLLAACSDSSSRGRGGASTSDNPAVAEIQKRGVIKIGTQFAFPNWGFRDDNRDPAGFDIDMSKAIAEKLGVEVEFVKTAVENRIPYLQTNKVDAVLCVFAVNAERAEVVEFTEPYGALLQAVVSKIGDGIDSPADLGGKTVGVTKGADTMDLVKLVAPADTEFAQFQQPADHFLALREGKVDASADGIDGINIFIEENPDYEIKGDPLEPYTMIAVGLPKGREDLRDGINQVLAELESSGETQRLYKQWFKVDRPPLTPTAQEIENTK